MRRLRAVLCVHPLQSGVDTPELLHLVGGACPRSPP